MRTRTYQLSAKANKVSKERKTHQYDCAKGANADKNISTERTNQGARAPLDRESAPKKRKKKLESTKFTKQQREQRKREDQTRTKASGKDKKNRKKQA